jgi:nicotinamide mononucleotide (NMN) deamidase PncC
MADAAQLLQKDHRIYVVSTGAGAGLQKILWDVPGISKVLVGAEFPYAKEATDKFLGFEPESYCSEETAVALAMEAYYRAFQPGGAPAIGLGLTGSVASNTAHRGEHRVFVATVTDGNCRVHNAVLEKGSGPEARKRDGDLSDALGLAALLSASDRGLPEASLICEFDYEVNECFDPVETLLRHPLFTASGKRLRVPSNGNGLVLFPGAFNPPHEGHFWMAKENSATFHITINPPHKPALSVAEMLQRAKMLEGFPRLFTKDDPLYLDKARKFPGAKIMVGVDAMERMLDPKWGVEIEPMMNEFRRLGIKFLVADRELNGRMMMLDDIKGAPEDLCQRILRPAQHLAMSSTKVREAMAAVGK